MIDTSAKSKYIFITGFSDQDIVLIKLNQSGFQQWQKLWGGAYSDVAFGLTIDKFNNIFITGQRENTLYGEDIYIVKLLPTPDNVVLTSNANYPDSDGNFTLSWSQSLDAENYSLHQSNQFITKINSSVIELVGGTTDQTYPLENLEEGVYYYRVMAFNNYGNTSSNCFKIKVQFPPSDFSLNAIAPLPVTDGIINLSWSESLGTTNYSIFVDDNVIYDIKIQGSLVAEGIKDKFYWVENLTNGDYFYVIVAINEAGETMSNCINVDVQRAPTSFQISSNKFSRLSFTAKRIMAN